MIRSIKLNLQRTQKSALRFSDMRFTPQQPTISNEKNVKKTR